MIDTIRITTVVENTARGAHVLAEHGLAFWIEADAQRILLDTGQGKVLLHNARRLEIPLERTQTVILTHGHFDHTGGVADVLDVVAQADLYVHPAALEAKYHREKSPPHRAIGISSRDERALRKRTRKPVLTKEPVTLADGIHLTGEIPRNNDFENTGGPFYLDEHCEVSDPLLDDQALYFDTRAGTVVVLGCAHSGVVNTLDYVARLSGRDKIYAVLGGMHLERASRERLDATAKAFRRYGVQRIGAAHCTGLRATSYLWSEFPAASFECCVSSVFAVA